MSDNTTDQVQDYLDHLAYLRESYVYMEGENLIIRIADFVEFKPTAFNDSEDGRKLVKLYLFMKVAEYEAEVRNNPERDKRYGKPKEASAWKLALADADLRVVVSKVVVFLGDCIIDYEVDGVMRRCLNTWSPSSLMAAEPFHRRDVDPWVNHVFDLVGDDDAPKLLDWFAWIVQHMDQKIRWAPIIESEQGTGKDLMVTPIHAIFGRHNTTDLEAQTLTTNFNEYDLKKFVVLNELKRGNGNDWDLYEKLKPKISGTGSGQTRINLKHEKPYWVPNVSAWMIFTNNAGSIALENTDRRFFVMKGSFPVAKEERREYYGGLANWLQNGGCAKVYAYLLRREVADDFSPDAPPAFTKAKANMIYNSLNNDARFVYDLVTEGGPLFQRTVITRKEVDLEAQLAGRREIKEGSLLAGMTAGGFVRLGSHPMHGGRAGLTMGKTTFFAQPQMGESFGAEHREQMLKEMPPARKAVLGWGHHGGDRNQ